MEDIKNKFRELSKKLMFDLNDVELEKITKEYHAIVDAMEKIKSISIENVVPTNFIEPIRLNNVLNEDEFIQYDTASVFANCKHFVNGMVVIKDEKK